MWVCVGLVVVVALAGQTSGINVLDLGLNIQSPTMGKFFGLQSITPFNATAIYTRHDPCDTLPDFSGRVVFLDYFRSGPCSHETRFLNLAHSGALAAITSSPQPVPGIRYHFHDGHRGDRTKHVPFLWLTCARDDLNPVLDVIARNQPAGNVTVEIAVSDNEWAEQYGSTEYIALVRVLIPILLLATVALALQTALELERAKLEVNRATRLLVLGVNGVTLFAHAIFLTLAGVFASDILPFQTFFFYQHGFYGWSMFNTVLLALFYREMNSANQKLCGYKDVLSAHRWFLLGVATVLIGTEFLMGVLWALYYEGDFLIAVTGMLYVGTSFITATFFLYENRRFHRTMSLTARRWSTMQLQRAHAMQRISERTGYWLIVSAVFLALGVLSIALLIPVPLHTPRASMFTISLFFFAKWGVAFSQNMALRATLAPRPIPIPRPILTLAHSLSSAFEPLTNSGRAKRLASRNSTHNEGDVGL